MKRMILAAVICSAVPMLVSAQTMNSGTALSAQDRTFIQKAAYAGLAEVSDGTLAESKGSPVVKKIGTRMVTDHTKVNDQLTALSTKLGDPAPTMTDAAHLKMHATLASLSGAAFDTHYLKGELLGHEKTIALFKMEAQDGTDASLKTLASSSLPTLKMHLTMIQMAMKSSSKTM